jgi:hypothetical protein
MPAGLSKLKTNYLVGIEDMEPEVSMMLKEGYNDIIEAKD